MCFKTVTFWQGEDSLTKRIPSLHKAVKILTNPQVHFLATVLGNSINSYLLNIVISLIFRINEKFKLDIEILKKYIYLIISKFNST